MRAMATLVGVAIVLSGCSGDPKARTCESIDEAVLAGSNPAELGRWMDLALEQARSDLAEDDGLRRDLEYLKDEGGGSYLSVLTLQANHCR